MTIEDQVLWWSAGFFAFWTIYGPIFLFRIVRSWLTGRFPEL